MIQSIFFNCYSKYYLTVVNNQLEDKHLNIFQRILRNYFGFYKETLLKTVAKQFCSLDIADIAEKHKTQEELLKSKVTITYSAQKAQKMFQNLDLRQQVFNRIISSFKEVDNFCRCALMERDREVFLKAIDVKPKGISNSGNDCYAISTMQAIMATPSLMKKLQDLTISDLSAQEAWETDEEYQTRKEDHEAWSDVKKALKNFADTCKNQKATPKILQESLMGLLDVIFSKNLNLPKDQRYNQQDAASFLEIILEALEHSYEYQVQRKKMTASGTLINFIAPQTQPYKTFQLSIKSPGQSTTLENLIQKNLVEKMEDSSSNLLESEYGICGPTPESIVFQIKRYGYDLEQQQAYKIKDSFIFNEDEIDLSNLFVNNNSETPALYRLVSCINHHGESTEGGHYTSFVRKENKWFYCNDQKVEACSLPPNSKKAYLLVFEKISENK